MAYQNDGTSHHEGIKNEKEVLEWLIKKYRDQENILNLPIQKSEFRRVSFSALGGTSNKADIIVKYFNPAINALESKSISVKKKTYDGEKIHGTFDLVNTSKIDDYENYFNVESLKRFLDDYISEYKSSENKELTFKKYEKLYPITANNGFAGGKISHFIKKINEILCETDFFILTFTKNKKIERIFVGESKNLLYDAHLFFDYRQLKVASSRRIYESRDKNVYSKTPFRIRLSLNNGINAVVGRGGEGKNQTSVWTIKVQVDDVKYFTNKLLEYSI